MVQDRTLRLKNLESATQKHLKDLEISDLRITTEYQNRLIKSKNVTLASLIAGGGLALILLIIVYYQKKQQGKHLLLLYEKNSQLWKDAQQYQIQKNALEKQLSDLKIESSSIQAPLHDKGQTKNGAPGATDTSRQELLEKIIKVFEGNAFLKNNFSLASLARQVKSNTSYVSTAINEHYGKNFNALVNEYRIRQACQYLEDPEYNRYTIEYVAQSVGYANKTTFYAAFKKHTGLTPSQYQRLGLQQRKKTL